MTPERYTLSMRGKLGLFVSSADRARLAAIIADRNSKQKHVWRAQAVLLTGDRVAMAEIMRRTGLGKVSVCRWQERYIEAGVDGLLRDKTRPSRSPKLADVKVAEVIRRTQKEAPPDGGTHLTVRAMAAASHVSRAKVHVIWREAGLVPHRWRQFNLSKDPAFIEKVEEVVGFYVDPPEHAVILSIDEKSQIQALDRTRPSPPMKRGRLGTMTHDYKRTGTTILFAALNVLNGEVIGRKMQLHRHQEFIRFLNAVEREVPTGKAIHVILDNYAVHKHTKVRAWLARHPRWTFHFHPHLGFMAQRHRGLLRQAEPQKTATRRLPTRGRPADHHQRLSRAAQPEPDTLPLAHRSEGHHRPREAQTSSVADYRQKLYRISA